MAVPEIDVDELDALGPATLQLVDVREPDEFEQGRVPGARLVPLMTVPDTLDFFDSNRPVYLVCASGGRSFNAATFLIANGFEAVNVAGGTKAWIARGKETESGPS
ncbi:MAG: rhodanese-like domain-containing protein [Acidimicrobiales bacterium]